MSRVFIENSSLQDIADAIRIKNGSSDDYYPSEMAQAIEDISTTSNMHDYLRFVAIENSTISITSSLAVNFEYSTDMVTWNTWTYTESNGTRTFSTVNIDTGNCIYVRGDNNTIGSSNKWTTFVLSGKIVAYGNIMYLLSSDGLKTTVPSYCFRNLFENCTALVKTPELPSTNLSDSCYINMFKGCSNLIEISELPATTLPSSCYASMFKNCTALVKAPELPAVNINSLCYYSMFSNCINIESSITLPATTLSLLCYSYMFQNCSKIKNIRVSITNWDTSNTQNWVSGVSATGTFTKPSGTTIPTGVNGIPSGWTIVNV